MKRFTLLFLVVFFVVGLSVFNGFTHNNSAPNFECYVCHTPLEPQKTIIKAVGIPKVYDPGKTYKITITAESTLKSYGEVQGGFAAATAAGELTVTDGKNTQLSNGIMTHTQEGSYLREWSFLWKAPPTKMDAEIKVMVVAADGDFSPANDAVAAHMFIIKPAK